MILDIAHYRCQFPHCFSAFLHLLYDSDGLPIRFCNAHVQAGRDHGLRDENPFPETP